MAAVDSDAIGDDKKVEGQGEESEEKLVKKVVELKVHVCAVYMCMRQRGGRV